ncbi:hypothetical protein [Sphingomonas sp. LHG3406-1]|uniref:hypothetical protein n=1 Tax=Sphingomonas sp. LHG3406-1 TaxID=2804617 RepID=UPI00261B3449|nr:hypothetical protein [Sphingomonas sp. LHG3406-1]
MLDTSILLLIAAALFVFAEKAGDRLAPVWKARGDRRLAQLEAGAPERYFEERRSLESRSPRKRPSHWLDFAAVAAPILIGTWFNGQT